MKKLYKKLNIFEKLGILAIIVTLIVTSVPYFNSRMLNAETDFLSVLKVEDDTADTKKLSVSTNEPSFNKAVLLLNEQEVSRSTLAVDKPAVFYIKSDGVYTVQILDANDQVVETQVKEITGFNSISITPIENSKGFYITSTMKDCDHFVVSFKDQKQEVAVTLVDGTSSRGEFTPKENGTYTITCENKDHKMIGTAVTYEVTSFEETPQPTPDPVETPDERIHINNEADIKKIDQAPSGDYVLDRDIMISDESSKVLVQKTFTGKLDGNGYQIKGLTQPLFASIKDAEIKNISLLGTLKDKEGALLSLSSQHSSYSHVGIQADIQGDQAVAGMLFQSDQDTITNSYVSGSIQGQNAAGFILKGKASISNSYVSGLILAKQQATGFSEESDISHCYVSANVSGDKIVLFNGSDNKLENSFYDINLQEIEDDRASAYTTKELLDLTFDEKDSFQQEKGAYPSIKNTNWQELAKASEALSRMALSLTENIHGITENITLPKTLNKTDLTWEASGKLKMNRSVLLADVNEDEEKDTSGILKAESKSGVIAYRIAPAYVIGEPKAGESLAETSTHISFNAKEKLYYMVKKKTEPVDKPQSHKAAIEAGWKRYLWNGVINWNQLDWNTDYTLYEYDMSKKELNKTDIKTNQGKIGGTITLSDDTAVGSTITAELTGALMEKGTWTWEKSKSLSATTWTPIASKTDTDADSQKSTYTPVSDDAGFYLRATFTATDNLAYTGSTTGVTSKVVTEDLTSVSIYNKDGNPVAEADAVVGNMLKAILEPDKFDPDVTYTWYHEGVSDIQGTGKEYLLSGKDVGKQVYVKATSKLDGGASGEVRSDPTAKVQEATTDAPTVAPEIVASETTDVSVTVKMPDSVTSGLYQFGYLKAGTGGDPTSFNLFARGHNAVTITGLQPNSTYYIYVKQIGENGHADSTWGAQQLETKTDHEHIVGTVVIEGDPIYGNTLECSIIGGKPKQTYSSTWYRVESDGTETVIGNNTSYTIKNVTDIGNKIKVIYKGTTIYAGEISGETEIVKKAEVHAPYGIIDSDASKVLSDTMIEVKLPPLDAQEGALSRSERYILGYSTSKGGVPVEYREDEKVVEFEEDKNYTLKGFHRNTTYYFFLRYAETEKHYKSDWSSASNAVAFTTKPTEFTGNISFKYANLTSSAIQGEKLVAELTGQNTLDGDWTWTRITPDSTESEMKSFYPIEGENATYIIIPDNEPVGTTYKVTFKPSADYTNFAEKISAPVQEFIKEKHDTPLLAPEVTNKTDTTLTFQMKTDIAGAVYEFQYSEDPSFTTPSDAGIKAYDKTNVTITGLKRNTKYYIRARRAEDQVKEASDYSDKTLEASTEKTDLHGYVTVDEIPIVNVPLTAQYHSASYIPTGDDTHGIWQWYREGKAISGATNATYKPVIEDIEKKLTVTYTGDGDFQSSVSAVTELTKKPTITNPEFSTSLVQIEDQDNLLTVQAKIDTANFWYCLQLSSADEPTLPERYTNTDMEGANWTKSTAQELTLNKDYKGDNLVPNTNYTLYIVIAETDTSQPSSIVSSSTKVGILTQVGNIAFSGNTVTGRELIAKLDNNNNTKGIWKWYMSTTDCGDSSTPAPGIDTANWTQIKSGYYPSVNSDQSRLTLSNDMFKKYIKAEFIADESADYKGTIKSDASDYIKKVYDETLTLTSSTKDGNGDPKAYAGTIITGTINNYVESETVDKTRTTVNFEISTSSTTKLKPTEFKVDADNNKATFTYTLEENTNYDGKAVSAIVSKPTNYKLYVDKDLNPITNGNLNSLETFKYTYGIPISSSADMKNFSLGADKYTDRSATYIITDNIKMEDSDAIPEATMIANSTAAAFSGTLNGDYHTVTNLRNTIFVGVNGTAEKYAEIKNLISYGANIRTTDTTRLTGYHGTGLIAGNASYTNLDSVFLVDSILIGAYNTGYMIGSSYGYVNVTNCGTAGGILSASKSVGSFAGLIGFVYSYQVTLKDIFTLNSDFTPQKGVSPADNGGMLGAARVGTTLTNVYTANDVAIPNSTNTGTLVGSLSENATFTNAYYNWDSIKDKSFPFNNTRGTGSTTADMIGDKLKGAFSSLSPTQWTYETGYYPRLTWLKDHPISNMYVATTAAFIPLTSSDTVDSLLTGTINGPIKIPTQLQKSTYSYTSSDESILKVTDGGTIVPVGAVGQTATITVKYTEPDENIGGTASNTFEFTIGSKATALNSLSISGDTNPGKTLTATVSPATGVTYQWYKRPQGTADRVEISGATGSTYTISNDDIGSEINVDVIANGYPTSSNYTRAITSLAPSGITTRNKTDVSIDVQGKGVSGATYEYAYAKTSGGKKIIVGQSNETYKITGLSRNTDYWLYARVAGAADGSYAASPWSSAIKITTEKTDISGQVTINESVNMGDTLLATMVDANLQTGTWKLERIDPTSGNVIQTLNPTNYTDYGLNYVLTKDDAGSKIRVSFVANGDFKDPENKPVYAETNLLLLKRQDPPTSPKKITEGETDHQVQVKETDSESGTRYEFGYRTSLKEEVIKIDGSYDTDQTATIPNLERYTNYYVHARKAGKVDYEPSAWSAAVQIMTKQTDISTSEVKFTGTAKVDQEVTFTVNHKDDNTKDQTGIWVLERRKGEEKNTLIGTTSADTHTLTYKIVPEDSGYTLHATYIANGKYTGKVEGASDVVVNNAQDIGETKPSVPTDGIKVYSIKALVNEESTDIYEFGYQQDGTESIKPYGVTATWGNEVEITGLARGTKYRIYVRKAQRTGYNASDWSDGYVDVETMKETLSGNITYTGSTAVGDTIDAIYEAGTYDYSGTDTTGSWQWQLDGVDVQGATSNSFEIKPMEGNPSVSVTYTANGDEGFQGAIVRNFGNVYKPDYDVPQAATVTSNGEDNTAVGSILKVKNSDTDNVYIYLRSADNDNLPELKVATDLTEDEQLLSDDPKGNLERWIKAETEMNIRVPANRSYVVYSARLENDTHAASEISSARGVLSAREPLLRNDSAQGSIIDENRGIAWKTLQEKQLSYSLEGVAPTATWKFYVQASGDSAWQNIDQELKALGRKDEIIKDKNSGKSKAITTFEIPMKYTGYTLKAELTGTDDYIGTVEFITEEPIEGKMINTGAAMITHSDNTQLLDTLKAEYTEKNDDMNGTFIWYRHTEGISPDVVVQKNEASVTSEYKVQPADLGSEIYAVYTASPYSIYSGTATTDSVFIRSKAAQNQPNKVEILQVNGNSVQVKAPTNYKTDGMDAIPQVVLGYQETDESGNPINSTVTWQLEGAYGDTWFKRLKKKSYYVFYAKYLGTGVYAPSDVSLASVPVLTENETFDENALSLTLVRETKAATDTDTAIVGDSIHASYKGNGYDEGKFSLQRSNGEAVAESKYSVSIDDDKETTTLVYTYTGEDVGSSMIVRYSATSEATHYDGYIEKSSNKIVTKAPAVETPVKPELVRGLDTNLFVKINPSYEYYLSKSDEAPAAGSGDWDILEANTTDSEHEGEHEFRNLERTTVYYLHARVAETENNLPSDSVASEGLSPEPFIDMGSIEVMKTKSDQAAMSATELIDFPYTLNNEKITIKSMTLTKDSDDTVVPCNKNTSIFANSDGKATRGVYEHGSNWANANFSCNIKLYGEDGNVVGSTNGDGTTLNAANAKKMNLEVYRANAVTQGGTYTWQALIVDENNNEALLQSKVTFSTQIDTVLPMGVNMHLYANTYIKQDSNTQRITNEGFMPVNISIGRNATIGTEGVPELMGIYTGGDVANGKAYLKISNDNSNYTSRWNGVWLTTDSTDAGSRLFTSLGHTASSNYYATGIADSEHVWPWEEDGAITNAYKIRFVTQISETDINLNTQVKEVFKEE